MPIGITVEGANILTRSLIIFGQGAIRCHPYVLKEMQRAREADAARALRDFDEALFGHVGFTVSNVVRALCMGLTGSRFVARAGQRRAGDAALLPATHALLGRLRLPRRRLDAGAWAAT